jgi:hypothetical protein
MSQETQQGEGKAPGTGTAGGLAGGPGSGPQSDIKSLFIQGLYAILFLIILIAALQLYFSIQEFIRTWFSEEYIPVLNTFYYLVVVVGGIYLVLAYIRKK